MADPKRLTAADAVAHIDRVEMSLQQTAAGISTALEGLRDLRARIMPGIAHPPPAAKAANGRNTPEDGPEPVQGETPTARRVADPEGGRRVCARLNGGVKGEAGMRAIVVPEKGSPVAVLLSERVWVHPSGETWTVRRAPDPKTKGGTGAA